MDEQSRLDILKELQRLAKEHKDTTAWIARLYRKCDKIKKNELDLLDKLIALRDRSMTEEECLPSGGCVLYTILE